ncbi:MAG: serine/threonine protein kinase [Lachnospiraceae bacterium]|nr:serine/threonine protein kinase [Lachnospiraceae bacterium]
MLEIGTVVDGKYKILNKIGKGGMSTVYLAVNERANKPWAIKEVRKDGQTDFEVIKQSQIVETKLLKKLNHPNLPSIIDVIDQKDIFLIVMDYIEGNPLSDALKEKGSLPCEDVIEWAKQLCDVLEYLHTRKPPIIYRDMKPSNVMLKSDGSVMLIDFGIAREFKEQNIEDTSCLGTRGYAAPEQFGGKGQTDARTDIYCLGATIYHLVTGHNPSDPPYEMYPIRYWNPSFSSGLEKIILKCTQKNPNDRYQTCAELLYALEHYEEEEEEYKKVQEIKWYTFLSTAVLMIFMVLATIGCYIGMNKKASSTYEEYLNTASMALDIDEKYQFYEKAIELSPIKGEAYKALLETMQADGVFSESESQEIRKVMPAYMEDLAENTESYIQIAYELGIMYFYYFENSEDIQNASKWLNIAIGNTIEGIQEEDIDKILGEKKAFRARHLYEIIRYYRSLDTVNREGDYEGSYAKLWEDLSAVITPDLAAEDNNVTALVMYNFMANQLVLHTQDYKDAGVLKEDMERQLTLVREAIMYDKENPYEEELHNKLQDNLNQAEKMIQIAFDEVKQ